MKPASDPGGDGALARLLTEEREELLAFVRRRAGRTTLRMETAEDLVQGVTAHVLERAERAAGLDESARRAWLFRVADNFLKDRRDHWSSLKRLGSRVLRMSFADGDTRDLEPVRELASSVTGPSTFAVRREQLELAAVAMDMLLPRDRDLMGGLCNGLSVREEAERFGLTLNAAERARERAVQRFRSSFKIALQGMQG